MKKIFSLVLALIAACTMALADTQATVDCGNSVQISATPATGYHFVKWNDDNTENPRTVTPTADVTFTAYFAINQYTITFKNYDGTELQSETLNHGDSVKYKGATPTKPATAQYSYNFTGWSPNIAYVATADAEYTAQFEELVNKYTVTFKNWDGTTLQETQVEYGATPAYTGVTPTKAADAQYTYTYLGWDQTLSPVTGDVVYTATFSNATNSYTITTTGDNGTYTGAGTYAYGTDVTITATAADDCYQFVKWTDGDTNASRSVTVKGDMTYVAVFEKKKYTVTVVSDNAAQGTVSATAK